MNSLSWLLYWADVLPGLSNGVTWFCLLFAIVFCITTWVYYAYSSDTQEVGVFDEKGYRSGFKTMPSKDAVTALKLSWTRYGLAFCVVLSLSMNVVPSKDTFYLIAASEAGEQALTTPEAVKIRAVINKWLDDAVKGEPEAK